MAERAGLLFRRFVFAGATLALALPWARGQQPQPSSQPPTPAAAPQQRIQRPPPPPPRLPPPLPGPRRAQITIDPKTPLKDLLPQPPKTARRAAALPGDDLSQVAEVVLEEPARVPADKAFEEVARSVAKAHFVNRAKTDYFMTLLLEERADLRGLPFLLGDACRSKGGRLVYFSHAAALVRETFDEAADGTTDEQVDQIWTRFHARCDQFERAALFGDAGDVQRRQHQSARVVALTQMMPPATAKMRLGMVKYLASVSHVEATQALARLALFAPEEEIRKAAATALRVRRERDYTEVLLDGFRYPWPAVPNRAAEALVRLERKDLAGRLVDILGEPDPSAPVTKTVKGKPVSTVRELVRINHHRNCLLCHAPASPNQLDSDTPVAAIPVPGESLPDPSSGGYRRRDSPETLVRLDVTYLRQDFSLMQPVENAHPWPGMQRFDFLVRSRELSDDEAEEFKRLLAKRKPGTLPPHHKAALLALRKLTGKDAPPTVKAWRRLLLS